MRADRAFRDLIRAAVLGMSALGVPLLITLFPGSLERALHGYDAITQACAAALYRLGSGLPPLGLVVVGLASVAVLAGAIKAARTLVRTSHALRGRVAIPLPVRIARAADRVGMATRIRCAADARPFAYCSGLLRTEIWISTGALARLRDDELEAVLRHESYHLQHRDPLRILVARLLAGTFFFFPLVRAHARRFELAKELDADQEALHAQGGLGALAGALHAIGTARVPFRAEDVAVGAWSSMHARVEQLCGTPESELLPGVSRGARLATTGVLALMLLLSGGQAARANLLPASVIEELTGVPAGEVHQCPLPIEGVLF